MLTQTGSVAPATEFLGTDTAILGDGFLKNVVAVFDYAQHEMKFAPRHANSSSPSPSPTPSSGGTAVGLDVLHLMSALAVVFASVALY